MDVTRPDVDTGITPSDSKPHVGQDRGTGQRVFAFLHKTGFADLRQSDEKLEDWIQSTTYEDFTSYITRLNGIITNEPLQRRSFRGSKVMVGNDWINQGDAFHTPFSSTKEKLLRQVFDATKKLGSNDDRALLLYYSLQDLHLFADGNGRTGRALYQMISDKGKQLSETELSALLDHQKDEAVGNGRSVFAESVLKPETAFYYIRREMFKKMFPDEFAQGYRDVRSFAQSGDPEWPDSDKDKLRKHDERAREAVQGLFSETTDRLSFRSLALLRLVKEKGILGQYQGDDQDLVKTWHNVTPEDKGKKQLYVDAYKLNEDITEDDVRRLFGIYVELDNEFFNQLIGIFESPSDHRVEETDLKNLFHKKS
jgi:hypothetical protein